MTQDTEAFSIPSDLFEDLLQIIQAETGHDFAFYKPESMERRIQRRMAVHQIDKVVDYVRHLESSSAERQLLFREITIGVTQFFRDPAAFDALREVIREEILAAKPAHAPLRVWVPACSTGEEAYSMAILLMEAMEACGHFFETTIFATDIAPEAIEKAREATYDHSIREHVSEARLQRFFTNHDDHFHVRKDIRDMVVFSTQNVLQDPPFSRLDLVSCRNLLIYLLPRFQHRLLRTFHYALNTRGILFLGASESSTKSDGLLVALNKRWRIFQTQRGDSEVMGKFAMPTRLLRHSTPSFLSRGLTTGAGNQAAPTGSKLQSLTEAFLLKEYAPACALINAQADILYIHGSTGKYLELAPGKTNMNLLAMTKGPLRTELTSAIHTALVEDHQVTQRAVRLKQADATHWLDFRVSPLPRHDLGELEPPSEKLLLVVFVDHVSPEGVFEVISTTQAGADDATPAALDAPEQPGASEAMGIHDLKRELSLTKDYLQYIIEQLETANKDLVVANETLQCNNEELHTANEELEIAKVELKAVNEEWEARFTKIQHHSQALSQADDDFKNLIQAAGIAAIFLDNSLRIRRFTPPVTALFHFIDSDLGRPITDIASTLDYQHLSTDVQAVIDTLVRKSREVQTASGERFVVNIVPFRTSENKIDGALVTFANISN